MNLFIYTIFQEDDKFSSTASLPYGPLNLKLIYKTWKQTNSNMYIYTSMHDIAKQIIMDNNLVSDKLKVSHSLTSGGTFAVYIVHPKCSDGYIKIVYS